MISMLNLTKVLGIWLWYSHCIFQCFSSSDIKKKRN